MYQVKIMSFRIEDILKSTKPSLPDTSSQSNTRKKDIESETGHVYRVLPDEFEYEKFGGLRTDYFYTSKLNRQKQVENGHEDGEETDSAKSEAKCGNLLSHSSPPPESSQRKRRILFTREQTYELQKVFRNQQYLTVPQRDYLSRKINLTPTQVKIWFQNHRYKLKKHIKECGIKSKYASPSFCSTEIPPLPPVFDDYKRLSCLNLEDYASLLTHDKAYSLQEAPYSCQKAARYNKPEKTPILNTFESLKRPETHLFMPIKHPLTFKRTVTLTERYKNFSLREEVPRCSCGKYFERQHDHRQTSSSHHHHSTSLSFQQRDLNDYQSADSHKTNNEKTINKDKSFESDISYTPTTSPKLIKHEKDE